MVTQYISQRQRIYEKLKMYLSTKYFSVEKEFFISTMSVETGVKKSLIIEAIEIFKEAGLIIEDSGIIKSSKFNEESGKSEAHKEAEEEFKRLGV